MNLTKDIKVKLAEKSTSESSPSRSQLIYDIPIRSLTGEPLKLGSFKGKYMLLVNVASKCGFTKQYKALQELSETYKDNLVVVGFPCNQFGNQEPGSEEEILSFCDIRYGVTFPLSEKINVKGPKQHPIYTWLTKKEHNGNKNSKVHWNFQKYLIDPEGRLIDVFYTTTPPTSRHITRNL